MSGKKALLFKGMRPEERCKMGERTSVTVFINDAGKPEAGTSVYWSGDSRWDLRGRVTRRTRYVLKDAATVAWHDTHGQHQQHGKLPLVLPDGERGGWNARHEPAVDALRKLAQLIEALDALPGEMTPRERLQAVQVLAWPNMGRGVTTIPTHEVLGPLMGDEPSWTIETAVAGTEHEAVWSAVKAVCG